MRLFAAIFPDMGAREQLSFLSRQLSELYPEGAFVASEKLHLTLRFFGDYEINEAWMVVQNAIAGATSFDVELSHVDAFPRATDARVLFCGLGDAARLAPIMTKAGEQRAYPHLTIARFRKRRPILPALIEPIHFPAVSIKLVESVLGIDARYEIVREWKLA
jgi:2'-5' RNA ligase